MLGLAINDRDWVVIGASPEQMIKHGFRPIGTDFPVFLHPHNHEEYALARTERKTGPGYSGFHFHAAPDVTLEQDLARRDLTINAIAQASNGDLIDPFNGQSDIKSRHLRHVSDAFVEDPVRILRVARFAARFQAFDFKIAPETQHLMQSLVDSGEVDNLTQERVWQECHNALLTPKPSVFFTTLRECGALNKLLPEVDALFGVPQPEAYHPEIDSGIHTLLALDRARELSDDPQVIFATLTHDLGKALTPKRFLPAHHGHEAAGVPLVDALCDRLRVPNAYRSLARLVCEQHLLMHRLKELKPTTALKLLTRLDAFRKPERIDQFALACQADSQGRTGHYPSRPYLNTARLMAYFEAANAVDSAGIAANVEPKKIGHAIDKARITAIARVKVHHSDDNPT